MTAAVDERTLEILDRRRRTAVVRRRGWLVRRMLLLADLVGLVAAFLLAECRSAASSRGRDQRRPRAEFVIFCADASRLDRRREALRPLRPRRGADRPLDRGRLRRRLPHGHGLHVAVLCVRLVPDQRRPPDVPEARCCSGRRRSCFVSVGRAVARAYCRRHISYLQNTIIVGAGDVGQLIAKKLLKHPEYGINLVGFVDDAAEGAARGSRDI